MAVVVSAQLFCCAWAEAPHRSMSVPTTKACVYMSPLGLAVNAFARPERRMPRTARSRHAPAPGTCAMRLDEHEPRWAARANDINASIARVPLPVGLGRYRTGAPGRGGARGVLGPKRCAAKTRRVVVGGGV